MNPHYYNVDIFAINFEEDESPLHNSFETSPGSGSKFPRSRLLRAWVDKPLVEPVIRRFIANSSLDHRRTITMCCPSGLYMTRQG
jgi:hypothetical protein